MAKGIYIGGTNDFNLVENGNFSNGLTNWTAVSGSGIAISSGTLATTLNTTLTGTSNFSLATSSISYDCVIGHIYYYRGEIKTPSTAGGTRVYFAQTTASASTTGTGQWETVSNRITVSAEIANAENRKIRLMAQKGNPGDIIYWDNIKLYDLTAIYGAGNEPTKTWCDTNLASPTITNNIARKAKSVYVGVDNVARKVIKGYIGVNNVARLFYSAE